MIINLQSIYNSLIINPCTPRLSLRARNERTKGMNGSLLTAISHTAMRLTMYHLAFVEGKALVFVCNQAISISLTPQQTDWHISEFKRKLNVSRTNWNKLFFKLFSTVTSYWCYGIYLSWVEAVFEVVQRFLVSGVPREMWVLVQQSC